MSNNANILSLELFFGRFQETEKHLLRYKITHDRAELSGFLRGFGQYERLAFRLRMQTATYFNVFQVMRLGRYEEKLHTPFLAHLLNPNGAHSQGRLFFDAFLAAVLHADAIPTNVSEINICSEHNTPFGRIDILIRYRSNKARKAIVIENKVYAGDQKEQLERYEQYLTRTLQLSSENYLLIYLSPWGGKPSEYSISKENYERFVSAKKIIEISYRKHIADFLAVCLPRIQAPVLAETVRQYKQIIQTL